MKKRILAYFLLFILLILLSISGAAYWLLMTSSGFQFAINTSQKFVPGLTIIEADGQLYRSIRLNDIRYQPEQGPQVTVRSVKGDWRLGSIFSGRLLIDQLHVDGVRVQLAETGEETSTEPSGPIDFELSLPININLRSLRVTDVLLINPADESTLVWDRFETGLRLNQDRLTINSLSLHREAVAFTLVGDAQLRPPYPINLNYGVNILEPTYGLISLTGTLNGDTDQLVINQQIGEPIASTQQVTLSNLLDDLQWQAVIESDTWQLEQFVEGQRGSVNAIVLSGHGSLSSADILLETEVSDVLDELPPLRIQFSAQSDDFEKWLIDSQLNFTQAATVELNGSVDIQQPASPILDLTAQWHNLQWPMQGEEAPLLSGGSGLITVTGTPDAYQATIETQATVSDEPLSVTAQAEGSTTHVIVQDLVLTHDVGNLHLDAEANWLEQLTYALNVQWQALTVPERLLPDMAVSSQGGHIRLTGQDQMIELDLYSDMTVDDHAINLTAQANSENQGSADFVVTATLPEGRLQVTGDIAWLEAVTLNSQLNLSDFNPAQFAAEWPGRLNARAYVFLTQSEQNGQQITIKQAELTGTLRDRPLQLQTDLAMRDEQLTISKFDFRSAESRLQLSGRAQPDLDLDWQLNSPDLADFYPGLVGRVRGEGTVVGALDAVQLAAQIQGDAIAFEEVVSIAGVHADLSVDLSDQTTSHVVLELNDIVFSEQHIAAVNLDLTGQRQHHDLVLEVRSTLMDIDLAATGQLRDDLVWQGALSTLSFDNADAGLWQLAEAGPIHLSADRQALQRHCWRSDEAFVCLEGGQAANQGWQTAGEIRGLPIALFKPFYQEFVGLEGDINAQFTVQAVGDASPVGNGELTLDNVTLDVLLEAFENQPATTFNEISLRFQLTETDSAIALTIAPDLTGVSPLEARLQTVPLYDFIAAPQHSELSMQVQTAIEDLSALEINLDAISDLTGQFNADIDLQGTLERPEITSIATLRAVQVRVNDLGILVEDINADVSGDPQTGIHFLVQGQSAEGLFEVEGDVLFPETGWTLQTTLKGQDIQVMNLPEALVHVSPDLQIALDADSASVSGQVTIPIAELEPLEFNRAVSPSQDVVIVNQPIEESSPLRTDIDVHVTLGDKVTISAAGFEGRLGGDLHIYGDAGRLLMANGEITLIEGGYAAYGQNLRVDGGKIRFSGGAIDNPDLDIRAVRTGTDWRAGIHITGPANNPLATLFSVPSMSQDNILSYILLGRPLGQASSSDANMLINAATRLGLANGNAISDNIANTFGLDTVTFTGDSPETAAVQIGKYLSPKLYIGYGVGIMDAVNTVQLRYELSRIWTLQAESGTESGVDLLYIHER